MVKLTGLKTLNDSCIEIIIKSMLRNYNFAEFSLSNRLHEQFMTILRHKKVAMKACSQDTTKLDEVARKIGNLFDQQFQTEYNLSLFGTPHLGMNLQTVTSLDVSNSALTKDDLLSLIGRLESVRILNLSGLGKQVTTDVIEKIANSCLFLEKLSVSWQTSMVKGFKKFIAIRKKQVKLHKDILSRFRSLDLGQENDTDDEDCAYSIPVMLSSLLQTFPSMTELLGVYTMMAVHQLVLMGPKRTYKLQRIGLQGQQSDDDQATADIHDIRRAFPELKEVHLYHWKFVANPTLIHHIEGISLDPMFCTKSDIVNLSGCLSQPEFARNLTELAVPFTMAPAIIIHCTNIKSLTLADPDPFDDENRFDTGICHDVWNSLERSVVEGKVRPLEKLEKITVVRYNDEWDDCDSDSSMESDECVHENDPDSADSRLLVFKALLRLSPNLLELKVDSCRGIKSNFFTDLLLGDDCCCQTLQVISLNRNAWMPSVISRLCDDRLKLPFLGRIEYTESEMGIPGASVQGLKTMANRYNRDPKLDCVIIANINTMLSVAMAMALAMLC